MSNSDEMKPLVTNCMLYHIFFHYNTISVGKEIQNGLIKVEMSRGIVDYCHIQLENRGYMIIYTSY